MKLHHGIYIHIPFCPQRCPYCNFFSLVKKIPSVFSSSLIHEFSIRKQAWSSEARSIYFGGGTPSLLPLSQVKKIVESLNTRTNEISIEINPEHARNTYLKKLKAIGISRVSLGIQSLDNSSLKQLNRNHDKKKAHAAIKNAKNANFKSISIDLIIGLKEDSTIKTLDDILKKSKIDHISIYPLQIKPFTLFNRSIKNPNLYNNILKSFSQLITFTKKNKFIQYEFSSFSSSKKHECLHNKLYWNSKNYLGIGPSAHSMLNLPDGSRLRSHNHFNLSKYVEKPNPISFYEEVLSPKESFLESCWLGLRNLKDGISLIPLLKLHQINIKNQKTYKKIFSQLKFKKKQFNIKIHSYNCIQKQQSPITQQVFNLIMKSINQI
ncbi:MAG: coproporphyrinogen III oxidase family protein [Deltaproteobacteria bacterium]|nr:MAG: coproporphyrinogen III oxidase family protein [Deltaproteobacteria bacterium]